jgi:hypothetical protein
LTVPDRYDEILAKQLVTNRETWVSLQKHGVTQKSLLQLHFFNASNHAAAEALAAIIKNQTDYEVTNATGGSIFRRIWRVEGSTRKIQISLEILKQGSLGCLLPEENVNVISMTGAHSFSQLAVRPKSAGQLFA